MAYVTKINNGAQVLTIRDPEAIHPSGDGDGAFNPAANIAFTGTNSFSQSPTVPTATPATDSSAKAASTEFVQAAIAAAGGGSGDAVEHRYAIVVQSTATCTLADRSVNVLNLGTATTATISMPPAVSGKARDLWLVLYSTATETKSYSLLGGTFYCEDDTTLQIEIGATYPNIFVFTEFETGKFIVSRRRPSSTGTTIH